MATDPAANPYAVVGEVDQAPDPASGVCGVSEYGELLVTSPATLPPICAVHGTTEDLRPVRKIVYWAPTWSVLLILVACLPGAIVYLFVRRDLGIAYFLSRSARRRIRYRNLAGAVLFGFGIVCLILVNAPVQSGLATAVRVVLAVAGMVGGAMFMLSATVIRPVRYDGRFHLKGLSEPLLDACR